MLICRSIARAATGLVCIGTAFGFDATEAKAVDIVVSWVEVQHVVRPVQRVQGVAKTVRLTLRGGNAISESRDATTPLGDSASGESVGRLRQAMRVDRNRGTAWRVRNSRTLVRTDKWPQHTSTMRVTMVSETECRASISYRLKPGFREYMMTGIRLRNVPIYFSALRAEQITCRATP